MIAMVGDRGAFLILLLISCSLMVVLVSFSAIDVVKAESKRIVVPDDYSSIPQAIDNADDGDTILVRSGTYEGIQNQTLVINKTISLIGEDAENTKIHLHPPWVTTTIFTQTLSGYTHPLVIDADSVIISGFTITSDGGIIRVNGNNTQIVGNIMATQLYLQGYNQTFALNTLTATLTCSGYYSYVYKNNAVNCIIGTSSGSYASIFNNTVLGGAIATGGTSNYAVIYGNTVKDGTHISLGSTRNIVTNNSIINSSMGVAIYWGSDNIISGNVITKCQIGMYKTETHGGNIFYANYVANNSYGAKIAYVAPSSETTLYHNNFIDNIEQVNTDPTETIGGYNGVPEFTRPLYHTGLFDNGTEGNFWSDYTGEDSNQDNIGDTPYVIDENRADNYPLMTPFNISSVSTQLPEWANITPLTQVPTPSFPPEPPTEDIITVFVNDVIDGDTFDTAEGYRIRLADIDAPETHETGYLESTEYFESLVEDKTVILDIDSITETDPYGRYVCLVFVEFNSTHCMNVNQALVIGGYAIVDDYTNNEFDPNTWNLYIHKNDIPEFPSWIILPLFLIATLFTIVFKKKLFHPRSQER